jgi:hypothetical protein
MNRWIVAACIGVGTIVLALGSLARARSTAGDGEGPFTPNSDNDTEVLVTGWSDSELARILSDYRAMYSERLGPKFMIRTQRSDSGASRISFPNDIPPDLLSFLVNYLQYPRDFDLSKHTIAVLARTTLTRAFPVPSQEYVGQKARIYVPESDHEYDLVYVAVGSKFFQQSFTDGLWKLVPNGRIPAKVQPLW